MKGNAYLFYTLSWSSHLTYFTLVRIFPISPQMAPEISVSGSPGDMAGISHYATTMFQSSPILFRSCWDLDKARKANGIYCLNQGNNYLKKKSCASVNLCQACVVMPNFQKGKLNVRSLRLPKKFSTDTIMPRASGLLSRPVLRHPTRESKTMAQTAIFRREKNNKNI